MYRSVSVRIEGVLAEPRREELSRAVSSLGAREVSWRSRPDIARTYLSLALPQGYDATALARALDARRIDDPALLVLEVVPRDGARVDALVEALGGPGRLVGIVDAARTPDVVLMELDATRSSLCLAIDVIDAELEQAPGRRIIPVLPLDDTALAAAARDLLNDPAIDVSRLIETHAEAFA
jgi:hypothetical protein